MSILENLKESMGLSEVWASLDEGARHRVVWVAQLIANGELEISDALKAWEKVKSLPYPVRGLISAWFSELSLR